MLKIRMRKRRKMKMATVVPWELAQDVKSCWFHPCCQLFPTLIISSCSAARSSSRYAAFSVRHFFLSPTSLLTYSCSPHWPLPHSDTLLLYDTAQGSPATEKEDKSSFPSNSHWSSFSPVLSVFWAWLGCKGLYDYWIKKDRWTQTACEDITGHREQWGGRDHIYPSR